jgi:DNA-nicking Smr family endonuclease
MKFRLFKIFMILVSFLFLTGFIPFASILSPGVTVLTSGNIYKATAQFIIDQSIKKKTGKNSLTLVKEELDKKKNKNEFNEELKNLVEKRIKITRKKLDEQELRKLVKKRINITRSIINLNNTTQ